jgi:hypothetical protein
MSETVTIEDEDLFVVRATRKERRCVLVNPATNAAVASPTLPLRG